MSGRDGMDVESGRANRAADAVGEREREAIVARGAARGIGELAGVDSRLRKGAGDRERRSGYFEGAAGRQRSHHIGIRHGRVRVRHIECAGRDGEGAVDGGRQRVLGDCRIRQSCERADGRRIGGSEAVDGIGSEKIRGTWGQSGHKSGENPRRRAAQGDLGHARTYYGRRCIASRIDDAMIRDRSAIGGDDVATQRGLCGMDASRSRGSHGWTPLRSERGQRRGPCPAGVRGIPLERVGRCRSQAGYVRREAHRRLCQASQARGPLSLRPSRWWSRLRRRIHNR